MVGSFVYGDFNSNNSGTSMPVEEPSTASKPVIRDNNGCRICGMFQFAKEL